MLKTIQKRIQGFFPVFCQVEAPGNAEFNRLCAEYRLHTAEITEAKKQQAKKRKEILALWPQGHSSEFFTVSLETSMRDDPETVCLRNGLDPGSLKKPMVSFSLKER